MENLSKLLVALILGFGISFALIQLVHAYPVINNFLLGSLGGGIIEGYLIYDRK